MDDQPPRDVAWTRHVGDFATLHHNPHPLGAHGLPTMGVAPDICDCCGKPRVIMALIDAEGFEIDMGVTPQVAIEIADRIRAAALSVIEVKGQG